MVRLGDLINFITFPIEDFSNSYYFIYSRFYYCVVCSFPIKVILNNYIPHMFLFFLYYLMLGLLFLPLYIHIITSPSFSIRTDNLVVCKMKIIIVDLGPFHGISFPNCKHFLNVYFDKCWSNGTPFVRTYF